MKSRFSLRSTMLLPVLIFLGATAHAQSALQNIKIKSGQQDLHASPQGTYSFKLYNGPGNSYGYDLLMNGRPVYHQFVLFYVSPQGKRFFTSQQQTEKVAKLAIDKIKQNKEPDITQQEIKTIMKL